MPLLLVAATAAGLSASARLQAAEARGWQVTVSDLRRGLPADTDSVARRDTRRVLPARLDTVRPIPVRADTVVRPDTTRRRPNLAARRQGLSAEGYPSRDSVFQRLMGLSGYRAVEYRGKDVLLDLSQEEVQLNGDAQTNYSSSVLEADQITYMVGLQFMRAIGGIHLLGEGNREVTSDSILYYDISHLKGTIMDARTVFSEKGSQWYVRGTATPKGSQTVYVERGTFTTCNLEVPHYYFKAAKIKVLSENYLVAYSVVFYIHGIPVAWLPFFGQDIRPGRHSGFLPPRFGVNDIVQTGNTRRSIQDVGYYLALSPTMDAEVTLDWLSGQYVRLNGAYRYNFLKKFLRGNFTPSYSTGDNGREIGFRANHRQQLSPRTDFNVDAQYQNKTRLFEQRTFDPREQTQTINTNIGFNHRFSFASLATSVRRQQFLGAQTGMTTLELPQLRMSFSPITLFRAPAARAGPFNNLTLSAGAINFNRAEQRFENRDNVTTTTASTNPGLRLGSLSFNSSLNFKDIRTIPLDTAAVPVASFSRKTLMWSTNTNYQVDLMGSTTLRPSLQVDGALFKSRETNGYISTPTRINLGATLSTDVYAFLPGFGPFSRIRHKFSPNFRYTYSPARTVADSLLSIPGFPAGNTRKRNMLTITFRQTLEAKVKPERAEQVRQAAARRAKEEARERAEEEQPPEAAGAVKPEQPEQAVAEGAEGGQGEVPGAEEETQAGAPQAVPAGQETGAALQDISATGVAQGQPQPLGMRQFTGGGRLAGARRIQQERKVTLLSINSSPLVFDFTKKNEPKLITDQWRHNFTSDLLRAFAFNMTLDLFEGFGEQRQFKPFLSALTGQFSINSQTGLAGMFGLDQPRGPQRQPTFGGQRVDSRYRLSGFGPNSGINDPFAFGAAGGGPWNLSIQYSLSRTRKVESGQERQSLGARLQFHPTPSWRFQWTTQYDVTEGDFASNLLTFARQLHRWEALFQLSKSPNGNTQFQVMVNLIDAPELRFDYDQQTQKGR